MLNTDKIIRDVRKKHEAKSKGKDKKEEVKAPLVPVPPPPAPKTDSEILGLLSQIAIRKVEEATGLECLTPDISIIRTDSVKYFKNKIPDDAMKLMIKHRASFDEFSILEVKGHRFDYLLCGQKNVKLDERGGSTAYIYFIVDIVCSSSGWY